MKLKNTLFIIPVRGGSKRLPRKNILPLAGKPMICYSIDAALGVVSSKNICVSTDDLEIKKIVEDYGIKVPFIRPTVLASDTSGSREVLLHAIEYYNKLGKEFENVCLLQATSPFRTTQHIYEAFNQWSSDLDMVVSVKETKSNPYFVLREENEKGYLVKSKEASFERKQDYPKVYELNGAIYIISVSALKNKSISQFSKVRKYVMDEQSSIDIDTPLDFLVAENILQLHSNN